MASSSNFPKGEDVAEVPCRQDPSEVGTLSGRVPPLSRPYPPRYREAFASYNILYPPSRLPPLRSGSHRGFGQRIARMPARIGTPEHRRVRRNWLLSTLLDQPFWSHRLKGDGRPSVTVRRAGPAVTFPRERGDGRLPGKCRTIAEELM